jgi:hypothetical protein
MNDQPTSGSDEGKERHESLGDTERRRIEPEFRAAMVKAMALPVRKSPAGYALCPYCAKEYRNGGSLADHIRRRHDDEETARAVPDKRMGPPRKTTQGAGVNSQVGPVAAGYIDIARRLDRIMTDLDDLQGPIPEGIADGVLEPRAMRRLWRASHTIWELVRRHTLIDQQYAGREGREGTAGHKNP